MTQITTTNSTLAVQQNSHPLLQLPAIREEKQTIFKAVQIGIAKSMADLNHKPIPDQDLNYFVNELTNNIRKKENLNNIRAIEIPEAFARGIRGKFGEYFGLNVISCEQFIEGYLESKERLELGKTLPAPEIKYEPDNETKFKTAKGNALNAFETFKAKGDYDLISLPAYSFLDGIKLIQFSIEEKYDFIAEAKVELKKQLESKKTKEFKRESRNKLVHMISHLAEGGCKDQVVIMAKKLALKAFFESIVLEDINLTQMIDKQKNVFMEGLNNG
ncbi:hypothetical protein [Pedobacter nototheniae]|uniref:hypothetical protein n=1 Tax=Pedobacter nototheniae TaxID=2488994 RepID=UPI00103CFA6B|nr:hypothetical protein [Pedobacter nototheniae]